MIDYSKPSYLAKAKREAEKHAKGEPVTVELVDPSGRSSAWWAFTTELGMYRIWDRYSAGGKAPNVTKGWSEPKQSFYVRIERGQ